MFKIIRKKIYEFNLDKKTRNINVENLFSIMKEYHKLYDRPIDSLINSDELIGFNIGNNYDIFYKNVHIYYTDTPERTVTRISIKKDNDVWKIGDTFSEDNDTMEVYLKYDIEVLGGVRFSNNILKDGNWDEYVFKTLEEIEKIISSYTRESKFNKEYDHALNTSADSN